MKTMLLDFLVSKEARIYLKNSTSLVIFAIFCFYLTERVDKLEADNKACQEKDRAVLIELLSKFQNSYDENNLLLKQTLKKK